MSNTQEISTVQAIDKEIQEYIKQSNEKLQEFTIQMKEKYALTDIESRITKASEGIECLKIRQTEIEYFKNLALSSFGTPNELPFDAVEQGFLAACLSEGKKGVKEYLESLPLEPPVDASGKKLNNRGKEKKT